MPMPALLNGLRHADNAQHGPQILRRKVVKSLVGSEIRSLLQRIAWITMGLFDPGPRPLPARLCRT